MMPMPRTQSAATRRTPRMDRQVQRVLTVLRQSPLTVNELADALFIGRHSAGNYVRMLYADKRIYVSGWQPREGNKPARAYSVGNYPDVHFVTKRDKKEDLRVENAKNKLLTLLALPQTVAQLAERAHLSVSRTRDLVRMLKEEHKVYIKAWNQPKIKGSQAPVYAIGNKLDCVRLRRAASKVRKPAKKSNVLAFVVEAVQASPRPYATEMEGKSCRAM